jgi:hypothetical protein
VSKHRKETPEAPSGRVGFDDRGNATWEWRTDTGSFRCDIDTARVRALKDATGVELDEKAPPQGADPYGTVTVKIPEEKKQRRTLNDMRQLSEEIKRARAAKKDSG